MKKHILFGFLALTLFALGSANAQTWTATDWQGTSQNISTQLNAGKAVMVDISAHWCGPCWSWHSTHIMEELYHDFGPSGTDEFFIFWIDGDPGSTTALLEGGAGSQGDWTAGVTYPIIGPNGQGKAVADNYNFPGYPTLFLHCGSGTAPEISRNDKWSFWSNVMSMCPTAFTSETVDATMIKNDGQAYACSGNAQFEFDVYNAGTTTLSSFDIEVRDPNGTLVHTENVTGESIAHGAHKLIPVSFATSTYGNYTAKVVSPNGQTDPRPAGDEETYNLQAAPLGTDATITVEIIPDNYGSEITWSLKDPSGSTILSGGPYPNNNNTLQSSSVQATTDGCYEFIIEDSYADGICCSYGNGSYTIKSGTDIMGTGGQYAAEDSRTFEVNTTGTGIAEVEVRDFHIYPNPTKDLAQLSFHIVQADVQINIFNTMGQIVHTQNLGTVSGNQQVQINTTEFAAGVYKVQITADNTVETKRLSVVK